VELRPISWDGVPESVFEKSDTFWLHNINLAPSIEVLFRNLHKDCLQRRIRRAECAHLTYDRGSSEELLQDFYKLLILTRRRHQILPQPRTWFRNLLAEMRKDAEIRVARKEGAPVAAILTLRHRDTVVYKYGCSDHRLHNLGGMPFLFWKLIQESKWEGAEQIDLGRTEIANTGLIEFKDRMGANKTKIIYLRCPPGAANGYLRFAQKPAIHRLFCSLPGGLSSVLGRTLYRHIG
jgi:lipid II:glycine glycyltransferase (peptidoglycan interpeptide bridge formation enzyme)